MMRTAFRFAFVTLLLGASAAAGCSSDDDDDNMPSAGSAGKGGSAEAGADGDSAGAGTGGSGGSSTAGTSPGGTEAGGAAGEPSGGMGGAAACVDPPVTPNKVCDEIPSQQAGDEGFEVTSPDFENCGEIPASMTCDGHDFGTGDSPEINWTGAPEGTKSFAVVFKDISLSNEAATERFGYHWVMWDIPADTTGLPGGMSGGYESEEVPGAHQWSSLGSYGFFTPCPNPFRDPPQFTCTLTEDSYAITVYALDQETLDDLPAPDIDPDTDMPTGNWVVNMGHYIEGLDALAVAEYRGTSHAWASTFVPPNAAEFPCTKQMVDDEMTEGCLH